MGITEIGSWITATGALGTAAFGLVDATKIVGDGGISRAGFSGLRAALQPFAAALARAVGEADWVDFLRAHWINGRSKAEQKAIVRSLIRLGLDEKTAPAMAIDGAVDGGRLAEVAAKLAKGDLLDERDLNVLGRLDAAVEARLDAAFDRAEQRYKNSARLLAGVFSVALGVTAAHLLGVDLGQGLLAGFLAVPLAPVAKDLVSSLSAAARAVKLDKTT